MTEARSRSPRFEFGKNALERVRVAPTEYRGGQFIDARVWVQKDDGKEWVPTKKGLTLKPEVAREVARAILEIADQCEEASGVCEQP